MDNATDKTDDVVRKFHQEKLEEFVPVITCLSLLALCGIAGNALTIGFYGFRMKWTSTVLMITALAFVDLFVCAILAHAITEIAVNVYYTNRVTCKIFHVLVHWAMSASTLILWLVSIDRYRRICRPLKKQIDIPLARKLVIGVVTFGGLLSIRDFINFDIIEFGLNDGGNATAAKGHYCTTTDNPDLKISVTAFLGIDALLVTMVMVTLIFTYGNVVLVICRSGRAAGGDSKSGKYQCDHKDNIPSVLKSSGVEGDASGSELEGKDCEGASVTRAGGGCRCSRDIGKDESKEGTSFKSNIRQSERSITLLMFLVSVGYFLCFVPYFIIKIGVRSVKRASDLELGAGTQFFIRLVYVNSFLNPVIYCAFNPQFRRYIRGIFARSWIGSKFAVETSSEVPFTSTGKETISSE